MTLLSIPRSTSAATVKQLVNQSVDKIALDIGELLMHEELSQQDRSALLAAQRVCVNLALIGNLCGLEGVILQQLKTAVNEGSNAQPWKFDEESLLITAMGALCAPELDVQAIARRLNRTPYSVALKALELGYQGNGESNMFHQNTGHLAQ